mgnify:CR=1 FL=1
MDFPYKDENGYTFYGKVEEETKKPKEFKGFAEGRSK